MYITYVQASVSLGKALAFNRFKTPLIDRAIRPPSVT